LAQLVWHWWSGTARLKARTVIDRQTSEPKEHLIFGLLSGIRRHGRDLSWVVKTQYNGDDEISGHKPLVFICALHGGFAGSVRATGRCEGLDAGRSRRCAGISCARGSCAGGKGSPANAG
jgi:hypothetical protein